jgi:DNA-binding transcriptional ArsR family regulator
LLTHAFGKAGAGHPLAQSAFLKERLLQPSEVLVEQVVGLMYQTDDRVGRGLCVCLLYIGCIRCIGCLSFSRHLPDGKRARVVLAPGGSAPVLDSPAAVHYDELEFTIMTRRTKSSRVGPQRPFVATAEQEALAFLAGNADREFYDRQVADETGLSRGAVNKALRSLARHGLLGVEQRGRMKFYRAVLDDPRVRGLKALLNVAALLPAVARIRHHALRVVLFGSAAEGRDLPGSDRDILVVTNSPDAVRRSLARRAGKIQAVVVTPVGLAEMEQRDAVFAGEMKRGIELWNAR